MSGLEFTDDAAKQLEKLYLTMDVAAQRLETIRHLNLSTGESVLDVGCGPGFLCESMAEIVGRGGTVVGIDISADLIARCNRRKASTWISYETGDATRLKQSDSSFDVVVCTQVAEYVADVDRVLSEAFRVLKPNGQFIRNFVSNKKDVSSNDVIEWHRELERLNESGRYFFSTNRYIFKASKSS